MTSQSSTTLWKFTMYNMNMKHTHCTTCGKEKLTRGVQQRELCKSCATKGRTFPNRKSPSNVKPHSEETRRKISIAIGGDGKLEERQYPGLARWTRQVVKRDGKCMTCGSTERLEAHHILAKSKWPQFATKTMNGITLCYDCHRGSRGVHKSKKKEV